MTKRVASFWVFFLLCVSTIFACSKQNNLFQKDKPVEVKAQKGDGSVAIPSEVSSTSGKRDIQTLPKEFLAQTSSPSSVPVESSTLLPTAQSINSVSGTLEGLMPDNGFANGFRASGRFGKDFQYVLKHGSVTSWWQPLVYFKGGFAPVAISLHPSGYVGQAGVTEDDKFWESEDGEYGGKACTSTPQCRNADGKGTDECISGKCAVQTPDGIWQKEGLHQHRMSIGGKTVVNTASDLLITLNNPYTGSPIKAFRSDKPGYVRMWYNSTNEIVSPSDIYDMNRAYGWPHYLLTQNIKAAEGYDFGKYSSMDFWMRSRIEHSTSVGAGAGTEMSFQFFWLLRLKSDPGSVVVWVGARGFTTAGAGGYADIIGSDQFNFSMCRKDLASINRTREGRLKVGTWTNVSVDVKALGASCLLAIDIQRQAKKLAPISANIDDYRADLFQIGFEGSGKWDSQAEFAGGNMAMNWTGKRK